MFTLRQRLPWGIAIIAAGLAGAVMAQTPDEATASGAVIAQADAGAAAPEAAGAAAAPDQATPPGSGPGQQRRGDGEGWRRGHWQHGHHRHHPHHHWRGRHDERGFMGRRLGGPMGPGMMLDRPLLMAYRQLNLSADQRQKVRSILMTARQQAVTAAQNGRQAAGQHPGALLNPGDPNYPAALQAAKDRAVARIQQASDLQRQLYNVLTPQQKSQLTQSFAQIRARMQARLGRGPGPDRGPGDRPGGRGDFEAPK